MIQDPFIVRRSIKTAVVALLSLALFPAIAQQPPKDIPATPDQMLHHAIRSGDADRIAPLIQVQGADPNRPDHGGLTPVLVAYSTRNLSALIALHQNGASCRDLPVFVAYSPEPTWMSAALGCGGDANAREGTGNTPLHILARRSHRDQGWTDEAVSTRIQVLLAANADVLLEDRQGRTALDLALALRNYRAAAALVSTGRFPIEELFPAYQSLQRHKPKPEQTADYRALLAVMSRMTQGTPADA